MGSAKIADDMRADRIRERQRKSFPGLNKDAEFRIERIDLRRFVAAAHDELIVQRLGREAPVLLEVERAGAALAAAEIEQAIPALASAPHDLPIHDVIGS